MKGSSQSKTYEITLVQPLSLIPSVDERIVKITIEVMVIEVK